MQKSVNPTANLSAKVTFFLVKGGHYLLLELSFCFFVGRNNSEARCQELGKKSYWNL